MMVKAVDFNSKQLRNDSEREKHTINTSPESVHEEPKNVKRKSKSERMWRNFIVIDMSFIPF